MRQIDISSDRLTVGNMKIQTSEQSETRGRGGGFKEFGGLSTATVVLPADHDSPTVMDGKTKYRRSADRRQEQP